MSDIQKWALDRPGLEPLRKLVLDYVVAWRNKEGVFFHSYRTIAAKLGLSARFVFSTLELLSGQKKQPDGTYRTELTLIGDRAQRAELLQKSGASRNCRANIYRVNYASGAADGAHHASSNKANGAHHASSNDAPGAPSKRRKPPRHDAPGAPRMMHATTVDDAPGAPEALKEEKKSEAFCARETHAAAAAAPDGRSGGDVLPATKAPSLGGTTDGSLPSHALRRPGDDHPPEPPSLDAYCDEVRRKREAEEAEWDRRMAEAPAARHREPSGKPMGMQAWSPARKPVRTVNEMLDELQPSRSIKSLPAPDGALNAARADLAARAAAIAAARQRAA